MKHFDVIIVEDNRHDVEMILDTLADKGIHEEAHTLANGEEAIDFFFGAQGCLQQTGARLPKLVLLDLKLPKVNGIEFLRRIRSDERTRHVPVVIFSSSNETKDRQDCYAAGANSYIVKPLDGDRFSAYVADIWSYWVLMNKTSYNENY
ncbi:MAG: response regulator [Smithellaceae bacterium]|nr:response regulator [Smithellaceae bacterium]